MNAWETVLVVVVVIGVVLAVALSVRSRRRRSPSSTMGLPALGSLTESATDADGPKSAGTTEAAPSGDEGPRRAAR